MSLNTFKNSTPQDGDMRKNVSNSIHAYMNEDENDNTKQDENDNTKQDENDNTKQDENEIVSRIDNRNDNRNCNSDNRNDKVSKNENSIEIYNITNDSITSKGNGKNYDKVAKVNSSVNIGNENISTILNDNDTKYEELQESILGLSSVELVGDSPEELEAIVLQLFNVTDSLQNRLLKLFAEDDFQPRNLDRLHNYLIQEKLQLKSLLENRSKLKKQIVKSTNIFVYCGIISILESEVSQFGKFSVEAVLETVKVGDGRCKSSNKSSRAHYFNPKESTITIDLVLRFGALWLKVKARNKQAIHENYLGMTDGSEKCITKIAEEMISASQAYPLNYQPRVCCIYFTKGVTEEVAQEIMQIGVRILVKSLKDIDFTLPKQHLPIKPIEPDTVNIDITTLIVLIADAAIGTKVHQDIIQYIKHKKRVVVTKSALNHFSNLLELGGGDAEIERANKMILNRYRGNVNSSNKENHGGDSNIFDINFEIIDDDPDEVVCQKLKGSKMKAYHRGIFGTAHKLKAITLTSNHWLSTNALARGLHLCVKTHDSFTLARFDRSHEN